MHNCVNWQTTGARLSRRFGYVGLAALLSGCALAEPKELPFQVIHEPALHSEMRTMSKSLGVIADLYFDESVSETQRYNSVRAELNKVERTASGLGGVDTVTNYSVINRYMGAFLYDVNVAKEFIDREPPNFVPAYRLIRSCQSCHGSMRM